MTGAYFCLVEHTQKKKRIRTIEAVPLYLKHQLDTKEKLEQYFVESYGYENPNVRIEKIKMYSLIKVNGFYMYLTGRSGNRLIVCNAVQMGFAARVDDVYKRDNQGNWSRIYR